MSIGQWRHPEDQSSHVIDLEHWTDIAKLLERGRFDALFLAGVLVSDIKTCIIYSNNHLQLGGSLFWCKI